MNLYKHTRQSKNKDVQTQNTVLGDDCDQPLTRDTKLFDERHGEHMSNSK